MPERKGHLHFLGIAGHTMRGMALAARELGYDVTGTDDTAYPPGSDWLDEHEFTWWRKPAAKHLDGVDAVIISGHVPADHPEISAAQERGIPIRSFPELVGELTANARRIVVAGTHGKTTTTSLLAWIFETAGKHPDFVIGIRPRNFDTSVRLAGGPVAVIEGDEYRSSQLDLRSKFAHYQPDVLVLTSIEMDHPDVFKDVDEVTERFRGLVAGLAKDAKDGRLYYWQGSEAVREVAKPYKGEKTSYDAASADWSAEHVRFGPDGLSFTLKHHGEALGELAGPLFGRHNVLNVIAAAAAALGEGIPFDVVTLALETFEGASRRFERLTETGDAVTVIDDYAHHPTEAQTTIEAVKLHFPGRVIAVYKPHTYSRTQTLLKEYGEAFTDADVAFITEIEGARERGQAKTVSGADVARRAGKHVRYAAKRDTLLKAVLKEAQPGDVILTMSVNGNEGFAAELVEQLRKKGEQHG